MGLTIKAILNKTRLKNDGTYPIVVRVTHDTKPMRVPTGLCVPEVFWDEDAQEVDKKYKGTTNVARINKKILDLKAKANDTIIKLEDSGEVQSLSTTEIKNLILGISKRKKARSVFQFLDDIISEEQEAKKNANAELYISLRRILKILLGHERLKFEQVDYNFLKKIETHHYARGGKAGGLSVYMRTLRAAYNRAIKSGVVNESRYPFKLYKIKKGKPNRKAMSEKDFEVFRSAKFDKHTAQYRVHKLYMASFYMRGMNWADMALLRVSDIKGEFERIAYIRKKTQKAFNLKISPMLREIIADFMVQYDRFEQDDFVFPILDKSEPEEEWAKNTRYRRSSANKRLAEIAKMLNIEHCSIYTARHTYAMTGKRKGVPVAVIKDSMGHDSDSTTQIYLDSFENDVVDKYDELIMA